MKKLKSAKILLPLLLCLLFAASALASSLNSTVPQPKELAATFYIGDSHTHKFHKSYCPSVHDISTFDRVTFYTREDAKNAGYRPCKSCKP